MKCRRSKSSPGSRLRGTSTNPGRAAAITARRHPARALEPSSGEGQGTAPPSELRIDGHTEGSIHYFGTVVVGLHGVVTGDIHATVILVEGEICGDLNAEETLRIAASARIVGDMQAPRVAVARGAQLRGKITMPRGPMPASVLDDLAVESLLAGISQI